MTTAADNDLEDPRVGPGICGHVTIGALGIEWICIRGPHLNVYQRRRRTRTGERYDSEQDQSPSRRGETVQGDRHYMVRRWPHRPTQSEAGPEDAPVRT